mgnify:CR=1 FL=1
MTHSALRALFDPRGVMVIGASASPEKLGAVMAASLQTSGLPLARVNPRASTDGFVNSAADAARPPPRRPGGAGGVRIALGM